LDPKLTTENTTRQLTIESIHRLRSSVKGNPAFRVVFTNGLVARTQSNASISYEVENPEFGNGVLLDVEFTPAGHIAVWRVAKKPEPQEDVWQRNVREDNERRARQATEQVRESFKVAEHADVLLSIDTTSRVPLSDPQIEVQRTKHAYLDAHNKMRQLQHDANQAQHDAGEAYAAYQAALQAADPDPIIPGFPNPNGSPIDTELSR
jgi:hypothetical protein